MPFTRQMWEEQAQKKYEQLGRLADWLHRKSPPAGFVAYGTLASFTIWPLVQTVTAAAVAGQALPVSVITTLGAVLSGVGSNLLAGQIQTRYENARQGDAPSEKEVVSWLMQKGVFQ